MQTATVLKQNISLLLLFLFLFNGCQKSFEKKMDEIFSKYNSPELPGAAVMIIKNGKVIFSKGYGMANVEEKIPVTDSTDFRLASLTKQFTATCILQLINEGKLNFGTRLSSIFPPLPKFAKKITIKNLLQHTSGLQDYESLIPDSATVQVKDKDVLKMISQTDSLYFEPGTQHKYSNTAYAILSLVVEKISGLPFREYLKKNIFEPLGMHNTLAYEKGINTIPNRAYGYSIVDGKVIRTDQSITSAVLGDGGIYSNLKDLYKWDQALYGEKVLPQKLLKEAFTRGTLKNGEKFDYGYGWRIEDFLGNYVVYHTGSTQGFRNIIYRIPSKRLTTIILTNRNDKSDFVTLNLAHKVMESVLE